VVLVASFSCLLFKTFRIDNLWVEDGILAVLNAFCLPGLVRRLRFRSVVFLVCEQASSTDAFVISYKKVMAI
jgi:hypothetical protein